MGSDDGGLEDAMTEGRGSDDRVLGVFGGGDEEKLPTREAERRE